MSDIRRTSAMLVGPSRDIGNRLKTIRLTRRMSREQFAELLEISIDFLRLIERGINVLSFKNLEVVSAQTGMPVQELFVFEDNTARHSN
jgi:transcriptional regulator with XRE-family HTH domain